MRYLAIKKICTGALVTALSLLPAVAALANGSYAEGGHHGMYGWGGFILGPIMMILILAAVVALVVVLLRWFGVGHRDAARRGALDILEERYARGEIDVQEFEERRRILGD